MTDGRTTQEGKQNVTTWAWRRRPILRDRTEKDRQEEIHDRWTENGLKELWDLPHVKSLNFPEFGFQLCISLTLIRKVEGPGLCIPTGI